MGRGHVKSSSEGRDKINIDQAAMTLRDTLAFATIQAKIPASSISVEAFQNSMPLSPLPSTINESISPFASPGLSSSDDNVGLGLKMDSSIPEADVVIQRRASLIPVPRSPTTEPNLYLDIFGAAYSRMTSQKHSTPPKTANRPPQSKSLSPHVRQGSSAMLEKAAWSSRVQSPTWGRSRPQQYSNDNSRTADSLSFAPRHSSSPVKRSDMTFPVTPSRSRVRSAGGSLLPNGHPASSLAQDLGIASGSASKSRNASRDRAYYHNNHRHSLGDNTRTSPRSSITDTSTFRTPQKRQRGASHQPNDGGNEAAAHSLLVLANSPSPYHDRHVERFAGETPSLGGLVEELSSPSDSKDSMIYQFAKMGSPPMTPPRSNRGQKMSSSFGEDSDESSPCPESVSRKGSIVLLSHVQQEAVKDFKKLSSRHFSEPLQATVVHNHDYPTLSSETPRTPPPLSAPSTPKAPGSNFSYGDFLHASPSPQPRMRLNSHSGTPRISVFPDTPTRGTKSRARFASYSTIIDAEEPSNLTELELSDVLTPGKRLFESSPQIGNSSVKRAKISS